VAFFEDPAIVAMDPAVGDPAATGVGWAIPAAGNPHVAFSVPAMITINPHITALRRWGTALSDAGRWADANDNLRERSCRGQTKGKK
jgi:hypothetical protein